MMCQSVFNLVQEYQCQTEHKNIQTANTCLFSSTHAISFLQYPGFLMSLARRSMSCSGWCDKSKSRNHRTQSRHESVIKVQSSRNGWNSVSFWLVQHHLHHKHPASHHHPIPTPPSDVVSGRLRRMEPPRSNRCPVNRRGFHENLVVRQKRGTVIEKVDSTVILLP